MDYVAVNIYEPFLSSTYHYRTLCDNYEWGTYTVRLGLLEYDFTPNTIKDTDAFGATTSQAFKELIHAVRSNDEMGIHGAFGRI